MIEREESAVVHSVALSDGAPSITDQLSHQWIQRLSVGNTTNTGVAVSFISWVDRYILTHPMCLLTNSEPHDM